MTRRLLKTAGLIYGYQVMNDYHKDYEIRLVDLFVDCLEYKLLGLNVDSVDNIRSAYHITNQINQVLDNIQRMGC